MLVLSPQCAPRPLAAPASCRGQTTHSAWRRVMYQPMELVLRWWSKLLPCCEDPQPPPLPEGPATILATETTQQTQEDGTNKTNSACACTQPHRFYRMCVHVCAYAQTHLLSNLTGPHRFPKNAGPTHASFHLCWPTAHHLTPSCTP